MPTATNLYVLTDAASITSALRASIFEPTNSVQFPESVLGDSRLVNLYLINSGGGYDSRSGAVAVTPRLALARKTKAATGGTFTLTFGANTTTALAYNATASDVENALNALASVSAAGSLDVSGAAGGPYTILFRTNGARALITAAAIDLLPSCGIVVAEVTAGDGSTRELQSVRIQTRVVALVDSWTALFDVDTVTRIGWTGTLNTNTVDILEMLESATEVDATVELELTESGAKTTVMQQAAKIRYDVVNDGSLSPLVTMAFATSADITAAVAAETARATAAEALLVSAINVKSYGAKGDGKVIAGGMTATSATFTATASVFTVADVGKSINVEGAGTAGADLRTTISSYTSATIVTLATVAITTVAGATATFGTNDTTAIQAAITAVPSTGGAIFLPPGIYIVPTGGLVASNLIKIIGYGATTQHMTGTPQSSPAITQIVSFSTTATILQISAFGCILEGLSFDFRTSETPTTSICVSFVDGRLSKTLNCSFQNAYKLLKYTQSQYALIRDNVFYDAIFTSIELDNNANRDFGDQGIFGNVIGSQRYQSRSGINGVLWIGGGGTRFEGNKINGGDLTYGFHVIVADGTNTQQIFILGNSIEGVHDGIPVYMEQTGTGTGILFNIFICNNEAYAESNVCIALSPTNTACFSRIVINGNTLGGSGGITINKCSRFTVGVNTLDLTTSTAAAVTIGPSCTNYSVEPQIVTSTNLLYSDDDTNSVGSVRTNPINFGRGLPSITSATYVTIWSLVAMNNYSSAIIEVSIFGQVSGVGVGMYKATYYITRNFGGDATATLMGSALTSGAAFNVQVVTAGLGGFANIQASISSGTALLGNSTIRIDGPINKVRTS